MFCPQKLLRSFGPPVYLDYSTLYLSSQFFFGGGLVEASTTEVISLWNCRAMEHLSVSSDFLVGICPARLG